MQKKHFILAAALLCLAVVFSAGCVDNGGSGEKVEILYAGVGNMPQLLESGAVDAAIAWQPFVAVMEEGQIGKVISYSEDLPPAGKWEGHTCCVFGANSYALANPEIAADMTALMILGNEYITANPEKSAVLIADWLFANQDLTYGGVTVNSVDVMEASIPTIKFSGEVTDAWIESNEDFVQSQRDLGLVTGKLANTNSEETRELLFDFGPYEAAQGIVESGKFLEPSTSVKEISVGYLASDHDGPLFVLLKDWKFFKDNYNTYLKPVTEKVGKIDKAELYINGKKVCDVKLIEGSAGPQLMTLLQQNQSQYAVAGTPPFVSAVDKSTSAVDIKILAPIMMNGSGLVVSDEAPADDWNSFIAWVKERSAEGKPVVIADPQLGSIQDVQLKAALDSAGIGYTTKSA
ncbi:MAG: ABC transporter substrate-binding protein [Methanocorpusculaceae archaeon]|nr:ABC transporter substrate-binding protein [Methanocorpusculaceae archaeon]